MSEPTNTAIEKIRGQYIGEMAISIKPCGKVGDALWIDTCSKKEKGRIFADWIERGFEIKTISRYSGDIRPEPACSMDIPCPCRELTKTVKQD